MDGSKCQDVEKMRNGRESEAEQNIQGRDMLIIENRGCHGFHHG